MDKDSIANLDIGFRVFQIVAAPGARSEEQLRARTQERLLVAGLLRSTLPFSMACGLRRWTAPKVPATIRKKKVREYVEEHRALLPEYVQEALADYDARYLDFRAETRKKKKGIRQIVFPLWTPPPWLEVEEYSNEDYFVFAMQRLGLPLSAPIQCGVMEGERAIEIWRSGNDLLGCFEKDLKVEEINALANLKPKALVATCELVEPIFQVLSPETRLYAVDD